MGEGFTAQGLEVVKIYPEGKDLHYIKGSYNGRARITGVDGKLDTVLGKST